MNKVKVIEEKDPDNIVRRDKSASLNNVLRKELESIGESFAREHDISDQSPQPGNHRTSVQVSLGKQKSFGADTKSEKSAGYLRALVQATHSLLHQLKRKGSTTEVLDLQIKLNLKKKAVDYYMTMCCIIVSLHLHQK